MSARGGAIAAAVVTVAVAGCGGSSHPSACAQYHTHVKAAERVATAHGERVARNLAVSLGRPAADADQRVAKTTAQAYLDTALEHVKRPANCQ